ncbi:hypothetical protein GLX27_004262 [Malassezia furfur]|uniref:G protein gamma domain-containing protein n=1 Tax=Malassezia furfur TaxID=55194 RepID=A0ABY8EWN9_MALFU|nr:hypothetical protein CBS14141_004393 [Malassezia furfur]WFD49579.1 hypothetical protein GLX27_004262 [Malassezia furfur]
MEGGLPHTQFLEEKLARIEATNTQLRSELERECVPTSRASERLIHYCTQTDDPLLQPPVPRSSAPETKGCCVVM